MAAVPIYVWNGTAWQETGPVIPASPIKYQASAPSSPSTGDIWVDSDGDVTSGSTQLVRYRFVASGGETSLSGNDANGATLAYTAGMEQVVLNGAVLVRGHDYTATNGTSITGLSPALVASDVVEVFSFMAFNVANTYTQSQVDGLIADAVGMKLIVPTSAVNGTVGATGAVTFSGASSVSLNGCFSSTYENYVIKFSNFSFSTVDQILNLRLRVSGADNSTSNYSLAFIRGLGTTASAGQTHNGTAYNRLAYSSVVNASPINLEIVSPFATARTYFSNTSFQPASTTNNAIDVVTGFFNATTSFDGFSIYPDSGTITGTIRVYGYKN